MAGPAAPPPPRRRLAHRVPVRLRQHWKLLAVLVAGAVGLTAAFGQTMIRPYITGDIAVVTSAITDNIAGTVDLFDSTVAHSVTVGISPAEYADMISAYEKDGAKKWVNADLVIDGTAIPNAAVRLKGNSTLMALRGDFPPGKPGAPGAPGPGAPSFSQFMGGVGAADADNPTTLPLLISFDENVDGRGYQGMTELSVRPGTPVLNEALALSLTAATDQPTQRYGYATYTINGQTTTRLLLEHPDEGYAQSLFDSDGYLYKADASSAMEFAGTDQSAYAEKFKQLNSSDNGSLAPVISFLQWLDRADTEEFDAHLADWVDVESFARYVATQNLLVNADDMAGPGQNYYLWYDLKTRKLSVISWDLNLAMTGEATIGPDDAVRLPPPPPGMPAPPSGMFGSKGPQFGNPLKDRFLASEQFTQLYHDAYWQLYDQMYADGRAHALLDEIAATVPVTDGLSATELADKVASMHSWIDQRTEALAELRES